MGARIDPPPMPWMPPTHPRRPRVSVVHGDDVVELVGVTAGLGVPRTLTWIGSNWIGSKRTAPDTPTGLASAAITNAAASAMT